MPVLNKICGSSGFDPLVHLTLNYLQVNNAGIYEYNFLFCLYILIHPTLNKQFLKITYAKNTEVKKKSINTSVDFVTL